MKKILAMLLVLMMTLGLVPALAEAPVEVTILLEGNNVSDDTAVMEKLNAYLSEKIGVTVKPSGAPGRILTIRPSMPSTLATALST